MKIGINAHLLSFSADYRQTGIGLYIEHLLTHLSHLTTSDEISVLGHDSYITTKYPQVDFIPSRINTQQPIKRIIWEQLFSHRAVTQAGIDVYHCPMHVIPLLPKKKKYKTVITVHDLANFKFPQFYKGAKQKYLTALTKRSAQQADRIIAVSENTKKDIVEILNVPESKIDVVYNGNNLVAPKNYDHVQLSVSLPEKYILFVGTMEPRKNLEGLLNALILLSKNNKPNIPLVLAGPVGWKYTGIQTKIKEYQSLGGDIIQTGYLNNDELCLAYKKATVFVYPSFYEGFGFPVLEAMSLGTPVITSNTSSLPEIGQAAVLYVDPYSTNDIADKIANLFQNQSEQMALSKNGLILSDAFTWEQSANKTRAVYTNAFSN
jgi:glycosyltransferase involved in cell wall biosynthesis